MAQARKLKGFPGPSALGAAALAAFLIAGMLYSALTPYFAGDESNYANAYFEFAKTGRPDVYGELVVKPAGMFVLSNPLLQALIPLSKSAGLPVEAPFRATALAFGALALFVAYKIFHSLIKSEGAAVVATAFLAVSPNFLFSSFLYYPDIFFILASLLSIYALLKHDGLRGDAIAAFFAALAFYIKLEQVLLLFAIVGLYMLLRGRLRLGYFAFSALFIALAAILIALPYFPNRMDSFMILAKTELFSRGAPLFSPGNLLVNLQTLVFVDTELIFMLPFLALYSLWILEGEDFRLELALCLLLLLFIIFASGFYYTALLFFGPALFAGRLYREFRPAEKAAILLVLLLVFAQSFILASGVARDPQYDYQSQKELGIFLAGKYPITFITEIPQMAIWKVYEDYYLPKNSPLLLANMRMSVMAYKFMNEESPSVSKVRAVYYNSTLARVSPEIELADRFVVVEGKLGQKYLGELGDYAKVAEFGQEPGFIVYKRKNET